ncbi:MAG: DUF2283 domain-containing protein [Bacteriovoracaceae bacterium]|nr:DUF2283 domain-containing protein [Bacteriovoracaceae bacterium]
MMIDYDKEADAVIIHFTHEKVVKDKSLSPCIFGGFSKKGTLVEIQILEVSQFEKTCLSGKKAYKYLTNPRKPVNISSI